MKKNILIATLGDHPAVITGMVEMLWHEKQISVDEVVIFHTKGSGKKITDGVILLLETLKAQSVIPKELPFADPSSRKESIQFLRQLKNVLDDYEHRGDTVYLSMAGGRKNMSALMAVICQFYPSIKGLFHLITHSDSAFPSVEVLLEMTEEQRRLVMTPPIKEMTLVEIPYHPLSNAEELRNYFAAEERGEAYEIELSQSGEQFLREVFQPTRLSGGTLDVYFSETAYEQLQQFSGDRYKSFLKYFEQMRDPYALRDRRHGTFSFEDKVFHFMKLRQTGERPFFYTRPNPVHLFPAKDKPVKQVIVCGLSIKKTNAVYLPDENYFLNRGDFSPYKSLSELNQDQIVILVPLGESPMIASQTYTLLQQPDREWEKQKVVKVIALYPEQNGPIKNGSGLLEKAFRYRKIDFQALPITGLRDVDSYKTSQDYLEAIINIVAELRRQDPDKQIALSLSGGRKGMSALTLFAAQGAGVSQVYHTTITDPDYEQQIFRETEPDKLAMLSRDELAKTLFLDKYDLEKFTLFEIPVINLAQGITP